MQEISEVDTHAVLDELQRDLTHGHTARTLAKHGELRILLLALRKDAVVPEHKADGRVSIHTIRGHVRVRAGERTFDLSAGRLITLEPGERHDVEALEDSGVLVTIAMSRPTA